MDPPRFKDLEYTMKLIFNHDDDSIPVNHNHSLKLLQASHVTSDTPTAHASQKLLHSQPNTLRNPQAKKDLAKEEDLSQSASVAGGKGSAVSNK